MAVVVLVQMVLVLAVHKVKNIGVLIMLLTAVIAMEIIVQVDQVVSIQRLINALMEYCLGLALMQTAAV